MPSRERVAWAKLRSAITAVAGLCLLGVFIVLRAGSGFFQPKQTIFVYLVDTQGMAEGAPVRLNGILIGKVDEIALASTGDPKRVVRVDLDVQQRFLPMIPADSQVALASDNLLGDKFVDITRGKSDVPVKPGGELQQQPVPEVLQSADIQQLEARLRQIDDLVKDIEQGKTALGQLVRGDELYTQVNARIASLERTFKLAAAPQGAAGNLVYTSEDIDRLMAPIRRIDEQLAAIERGEGAGRFIRDPELYESVRRSIEQIRANIRQIAASPIIASDEMYNNLLAQIRALDRQVDAIRSMEMLNSTVDLQQIIGQVGELQTTIRDFRKDPQKFLRVKIF